MYKPFETKSQIKLRKCGKQPSLRKLSSIMPVFLSCLLACLPVYLFSWEVFRTRMFWRNEVVHLPRTASAHSRTVGQTKIMLLQVNIARANVTREI